MKKQNRTLPFHCQRKPTQQHAPTTPSYAPPTLTQPPLSTTCPQPLPLPPPTPTFHPSIVIGTQNVGGMRGEFQLKRGPKISMIRRLVTPYTDFFVLTEIRADQRAIMNTKIKYGHLPITLLCESTPTRGCPDLC